jgi:hypothetical protein
MTIEVDYINTPFYHNTKLKELSDALEAVDNKIVVANVPPNNADGRPNGTIYFEVV